jgi:hypothetical protein
MVSESSDDPEKKSVGNESAAQNSLLLSRRSLGKGAAVLAGVGGTGLGYLWLGSEPTLALESTDAWVANSASITTADGTIDSITFGDPENITDDSELTDDSNRLTVNWAGFNAPTREATFNIYLQGTDGGDGGDWAGGGATTAQEVLATGSETLEGTNGSDAFTWTAVFGEAQPVNVADHTGIEMSDFAAVGDEAITVRELAVRIEVVVPEENDLTASKRALATITVSNEEISISVGGQGSFEIESDAEVNESAP